MRTRTVFAVAAITLVGMAALLWNSGRMTGGSASDRDIVSPAANRTAVDHPHAARPQPTTDDPFAIGSKRRSWEERPFALIESGAEQGDARAQWLLSLMYDDCFSCNLQPAASLQGMEMLAGLTPESATGLDRIEVLLGERRATVDNGAPIPSEAVTLWLEQSAEQEFIPARLRQTVLSRESNPAA